MARRNLSYHLIKPKWDNMVLKNFKKIINGFYYKGKSVIF